MSTRVNIWNENMVEHKSTGIAVENIRTFAGLAKESLKIKNEETFKKLEATLQEMSQNCLKGGSISRFLDYSEGDTKNFAALHCVKDPLDGTLTIAYAIHTITFQMEEGGNAVTELPEGYQRSEAEQRLKEMGFHIAANTHVQVRRCPWPCNVL